MKRILLLLTLTCLAACSTLSGNFEAPTVKVTAIEVLPSEGLAPRFAVTLSVMNPNRQDLSVRGMSYSMALADFSVLSGVSDQIPVLAAYRETPVRLEMTADLLQALRLVESLTRQNKPLDYRFDARLDLGAWKPDVRISESGNISLNNR